MVRRIAVALGVVVSIFLSACSEDSMKVDLGPVSDGPGLEAGGDYGPEQGPPDAALSDRIPETAADVSQPDTSPPDLSKVDVSQPDLSQPDVSQPDLPQPDVSQPDALQPDVFLPDMSPLDKAAAQIDALADVALPMDSAPTDTIVTDAGSGLPNVIHKGESSTITSQMNRSLVRDGTGRLYYCYRTGAAPFDLNIARSTNGGVTWGVWAAKLNSESFAYTLSGCSMAVDRDSALYVVWHRYSYSPTKHATYLKKYNSKTSTWSTQKTIKTISNKTSTSSVAVDSLGYVYLLAGSNNWHFRLHKSKTPYASTSSFTDLGDPSTNSYSQTGAMTIDSNDNVHVAYYDVASSAGVIYHRYYSAGWKTATVISTTAKPNDKPGPLAADGLGNVHILYVDGGGDNNASHTFRYRKWSAGTLGPPVLLYSHTATQHGKATIANPYIVNIATHEATGIAYVVGRNMNEGGALCLYKKALSDTTFSLTKKLMPANAGKHYYYMPRIRGTVYPLFNQTGMTLDMTWIQDASANPSTKFMRIAAP